MKPIIGKVFIVVMAFTLVFTIYLLNRPRNLSIDNLYDTSDVGVLMDNQTGSLDTGVIGFEKYIENDFLALYFDEDTTHFAVKDKRNDYTWLSSTKKNDPLIKTASIRNLQRSTFQITYLQQDGTVATMNNYEYSIAYKRDFDSSFTIDYLDNGLDITYTLLDRDPKGHWFPAYISADRFTDLVLTPVQLNGSAMDLRNLLDYYKPMEDDPTTYEITQLIKDEETNEYDMNTLSGAQVETLFKLFYEIGYYGNKQDENDQYIEEYQLDDVEFDNSSYGIILNYTEPEFVIPMEVTLLEDHLEVKINYYKIEEKNGFEIVSIRLLPYFGAVRNDTEGYTVIPEGSGGLIYFNNGKTDSKSYSSFIYGMDNTLIPEEMVAKDTGSHIPIFGLKTPNNAMLGIIESGASHSKITADVSEKYDSYNKVYNEFIFKQAGSYKLAENTIQLWSDNDYTYSPIMRYYFFSDEDANYSCMAQLFGSYLQAKYRLEELTNKTYRLYLDILGSYDLDTFFLWFPTNKNMSLTTYQQAEIMIQELKNAGVEEQLIRYIGWFNNGIEHSVPRNIDLDNAVGNKKDLKAFNTMLEELGYPVFYDVDFVKTYDSSLFYSSRNYSRVIGGNVSKFYEYSLSSSVPNTVSDPYYLSNLSAIDRNTTAFEKDARKLDLPGISFRNLGDIIYSDYQINNLLPREFVSVYYQDILAKFNVYNVMVEQGNMYSLSITDYITDLETQSSLLVVVDKAIPFYQIAIAPYINYSMRAFNYENVYEQQEYILKGLETGSNLKAMVSYTDTSTLLYTDFNEYYSVFYDNTKDNIIAMMNAFDSFNLGSSYLVAHEIIAANVVRCTYSNGSEFVINYRDNSYDYDGTMISPQSYVEIEVD